MRPNKMTSFRSIGVLLLVSCSTAAWAQPTGQTANEIGLPFFSCFSMLDINAGGQNWQFLQDDRGVLYVANNFGVLEYDGASWRIIRTPLRNVIRSLDMDAAGRIYVGSFGEIGYLAADQLGLLAFVSLDTLLDDADRNFADVWTTQVMGQDVVFQSREEVIRMTPVRPDPGPRREDWNIKVWTPEDPVLWTFDIGGELWVHQRGVGMSRMVGDSLQFVRGSEVFANDRVQVALPMKDRGDDAYVFIGFTTGPYLYQGGSFGRFSSDAVESMKESVVYKGSVLSDGSFAAATLTGGLLFLDRSLNHAGTFTTAAGFSTNSLTSAYVDKRGMLWASPENSICQIETPSPLTRFGSEAGIEGTVAKIIRHDGRLYATTTLGLVYLDSESRTFRAVRGIAGGNPQAFGLLQFDDRLLAATSAGVYEVHGETATPVRRSIAGSYEAQVLSQSKMDPRRVFVATSAGVFTLYLDPSGKWIDEGPLAGADDYVTHIVEPRPGEIWLGPIIGGAVRLRFTDASNRPARIDRFTKEHGLNNDGGVSVYTAAGRVIFAQNEGIFLFDETTGRFQPDPLLGDVVSVGGSQEEFQVVEDRAGNIWTNFGGESAVLRPNGDGTYRTEKIALQRFASSPATAVYPEENGVVWFGGNGEVIRYDPRVPKDYGSAYPALVRRVIANDDSTIFGGAPGLSAEGHELTSDLNALRIEFAVPSYEDPRSNRYRTTLEGFDEHWSGWSGENRRDYTNLPAGEYTFRVQARNVYGQESEEASFSFRILPAWYETWWAWLLYVGLGGGAIVALIRVRTQQLKRRSLELEAVVDRRTGELRDKNLELEKQRDELEQAYENVELLSRVGQDITSRLSIKEIIDTVYENVNALMDAAVFGIGIYDPESNRIEMPATKENGVTLPVFYYPLDDESRPAVWAYNNKGEIFFNDYEREYAEFFGKELVAAVEGDNPQSMIYLPLINKDKAIGVITAQSFRKQAYTEYHLNILRNLAIYAAIAIDNAEAYRRLNATLGELNATVQNLKTTQQQLVTQEKLASLGSLTAGIAHEIKNPLNFVNNFAELVSEMARELGEEITANKDRKIQEVFEELDEILTGLKINAAQIKKHGRRADGIVMNMMQHAQEGEGERYTVVLNDLVEEYVGLAYHGAKAKWVNADVEIHRDYDESVGSVELMPQEVGRVFLNLLSNAFDAVIEKADADGDGYKPFITVTTRRRSGSVEVTFADNGPGIPDHVRSRIFEPFFTTKPTGGGTGLGLSLSYDIVVHGHGGSLSVESTPGEGASFTVVLPVKAARGARRVEQEELDG